MMTIQQIQQSSTTEDVWDDISDHSCELLAYHVLVDEYGQY